MNDNLLPEYSFDYRKAKPNRFAPGEDQQAIIQYPDVAKHFEEPLQEEGIAEVEADNAQWDTLLVTNEAQALLEELADEALVEHRAGKIKLTTAH